jgi:hypothetical protein
MTILERHVSSVQSLPAGGALFVAANEVDTREIHPSKKKETPLSLFMRFPLHSRNGNWVKRAESLES